MVQAVRVEGAGAADDFGAGQGDGPTARTLRFYDEVGLVPPAGTTPSGKHSTVKY